MEETKRFTIGKKMYLFVVATVLFATACVCILNYVINVDQINTYYKRLTINNAKNYATLVDADFLKELREVVESEEYQALRDEAEAIDDETLIQDYLIEQGLWDKYYEEREKMRTYVKNMEDVEYLYIVVWNEDPEPSPDGIYYDMYLMDADDVELYMTGYWENREAEFDGVDYRKTIPPIVSRGDWGWLCSGYEPIYDEDGTIICHVGCDISMTEMMAERYSDLVYMIISALIVTAIALIGAFVFVTHNVVRPLTEITEDMKRFSPAPGKDYIESGVTNIYVSKEDEIGDIYTEIKTMQERIVDYVNDMTTIKRDMEKAEVDVKLKEQEIGEISKEAFKDALTGIGNLNAYKRKVEDINRAISNGYKSFAVVMMDVNWLKYINDNFGHAEGDAYLMGNSHIICEVFKHSPVYRIGGDEFVAVLAGEDYKHRDERIEELRSIFDKTYKDESVDPWERYSVSAGMADFTSEDQSVEDVLKRADKIMYAEKEAFKKNNAKET